MSAICRRSPSSENLNLRTAFSIRSVNQCCSNAADTELCNQSVPKTAVSSRCSAKDVSYSTASATKTCAAACLSQKMSTAVDTRCASVVSCNCCELTASSLESPKRITTASPRKDTK